MNEKLYRSSPAAGNLLRPSCAPLHRHKLGFKRAPKKCLRVSHFQKFCPGSYFTNFYAVYFGQFVSRIWSGHSFYKVHRVQFGQSFPKILSGQLFYKFLRCIVRSVCLQNFVPPFILQSSPCIVRSVISKILSEAGYFTNFTTIRSLRIFLQRRNHTIFNFVREQSIYVKSRVQFTGERLSYFPLIGSFSHTEIRINLITPIPNLDYEFSKIFVNFVIILSV